ncbi:MAG: cupin domain-containing protein [Sporichthyaceae bacterium]
MPADPAAPLVHSAASDHVETDATPGMTRRRAVDTGTMWAGTATTAPGTVSGWHHHGAHESTIYVVRGALHMDFGADGGEAVDAVVGDVVQVPAGAVHRESNPLGEDSVLFVVRCGTGEPTVNVDGPAPG